MIKIGHHQITQCSSCGLADESIKVYIIGKPFIAGSIDHVDAVLCPSCIGEAARVIADAVEEKRKMQERVR